MQMVWLAYLKRDCFQQLDLFTGFQHFVGRVIRLQVENGQAAQIGAHAVQRLHGRGIDCLSGRRRDRLCLGFCGGCDARQGDAGK